MNWYLEQVEAELQSEQELTERKVLVEKVLERLVKVVSNKFRIEGEATIWTFYPPQSLVIRCTNILT